MNKRAGTLALLAIRQDLASDDERILEAADADKAGARKKAE